MGEDGDDWMVLVEDGLSRSRNRGDPRLSRTC